MSIFYSQKTGGFYVSEIHESIPDDSVMISEELYHELLNGQSKGKRISLSPNGSPVLTDVVFTEEQRLVAAKRAAGICLKNTDWYVTRMMETGKPIPDDVLQKRQEARALLN